MTKNEETEQPRCGDCEALEDFKKLLAEKPLIDGPVVANPPIASGPRFIKLHTKEEHANPRSTWVNTLDIRRMQPVKNNWGAKTRIAGQPKGSWIMVAETVAEILALIEEAHQ